MFTVNGEKLNLKDFNNPFVDHYNKKVRFIKDYAKRWHFRYPDTFGIKANPLDPETRDEYPVECSFKTLQSFAFTTDKGDSATVEVQYYTHSKAQGKGEITYLPRTYAFRGEKILNSENPKDLDEIFFLLFVSPHCQKIEGIKGQNLNSRSVYYTLYDKDLELSREVDRESKLAEVKSLIYSKRSGLPVEMLREIAMGYGFTDQSTMTDDEVKKMLADHVLGKRKGAYKWDLIDEFIESPFKDKAFKLKAIIESAVTERVIEYRKPIGKGKGKWYFHAGTQEHICDVPLTVKPIEFLINHLDRYPNIAETIEGMLEEKKPDVQVEE